MTILWKNLHLIWDCGVTDLVYSGLWEYIKGRVLGVQRDKHQMIRDMQHLKDLLKEKREELPQYESDACINQFRYRLLKVIEVAGKHILNIFSRFAVERNV